MGAWVEGSGHRGEEAGGNAGRCWDQGVFMSEKAHNVHWKDRRAELWTRCSCRYVAGGGYMGKA